VAAADGFFVTSPVRLQPVVHDDVEVLVRTTPGALPPGSTRDQVLGVGAASLTLAAARLVPPSAGPSTWAPAAACRRCWPRTTARTCGHRPQPRATAYTRLALR
jgi:hypothetical protein